MHPSHRDSYPAPRLVFWELTSRCNLDCLHCRAGGPHDAEPGVLNTEQILKTIDDIEQVGKPILVLTGGEPLLRKDLFDIIPYAVQKGFRIALASNGVLINKKMAIKIKEASVARVSLSIDGASAQTHDSFRGLPGSFKGAMDGFENLKSAGIPVQLNTTITKANINELPEIMHLAENMGAVALHIFLLVPVGCGMEISESMMISPQQYEETLEWFYHRSKEVSMELKATCAPHYYRILHQHEGKSAFKGKHGFHAITKGCLAGSGVCFISHQGDVQPCGYLPVKAGNVLEKPFREIWNNSLLFKQLRDVTLLKGKCGICEYRGLCLGCRARAFGVTGDYLDEEPFCIYEPKLT